MSRTRCKSWPVEIVIDTQQHIERQADNGECVSMYHPCERGDKKDGGKALSLNNDKFTSI